MSRFGLSSRRAFAMMLAASMFSAASCLTISDPPEGLSVLTVTGGNNQNVQIGTMASLPLSVQALDEISGPMEGVTVTWLISSGEGVLSTTSTTTNEAGQASINFTASTTPGPVLVRATAEELRVTFTVNVLTVLP